LEETAANKDFWVEGGNGSETQRDQETMQGKRRNNGEIQAPKPIAQVGNEQKT